MAQPILESTDDKFIITIDKNAVDKMFLLQLFEKLRLEYMAHHVNFDDSIKELGEEMKENWWAENKERFLNQK